MAERSGLRRATNTLSTAPLSSYNDEWHGRRMQLLMKAGAGRFLDSSPESLMALAQSPTSDNDMLDNFLRAYNQTEFNQMRHTFDAMPDQIQKAEFGRLPEATQQILLSGGYEPPDEEQKSLIRRMLTWDIPLLPEEHMGQAIGVAMAPVRTMGWFAGKAASTAWEWGVMKPSRFATRTGRSGAYLAEKGMGSFFDPRDWRESWNETKHEENSYYSGTVKKAERIVGRHQTRLLRAYLEGGQQGAYDLILKEGQKNDLSEEKAKEYWRNWQSTLAEDNNVKALEILESGKLTLFDASQRTFNTLSPWDVNPDSWQGKTVGMVGALATEILLDPTTWGGGALFKIAKHAKVGMRAGMTADAVHFSERLSKALRAEAALGETPSLMAPIRIWNPTTGTYDDALSEVKEWVAGGGVGSTGSLTQGNIPIGRGKRLIGKGAEYLAQTNPMLRSQHRAINRLIDRINDAFKHQDEIDEFSRVFRLTNPDENVNKAVTDKFGNGGGLGQLMRDLPAMAPIMGDMWNWHLMRRRMTLTVDARHIDETGMWKVFDDEGKLLGEARIKGDPSNPLVEGDVTFTNEGTRLASYDKDGNFVEHIDFQTRTFPTLANEQGFWDFLQSQTGWEMMSSKVGGVDPDAIFLPRMSKFGEQWAEGKKYIKNDILSFDNLDTEVVADLARGAATWLVEQGNYIHVALLKRIDDGTLVLSKEVDARGLQSIMDDPSIGNARKHGLGETDLAKIDEARLELEPQARQFLLDDGEMDALLMYHQGRGVDIIDGVPVQDITALPFAGARRARQNYLEGQIHKAGGTNAELDWWHRGGIISKATLHALAYYPARFAEKLTTYVPKAAHIDVSSTNLAISEFQGLVDMGILVDMPRTQIDNYLRAYTMGNDSEKWLVTTEFYLDFLGRSGALMHGGRDVQRFVEKFIRHGTHRYGNIVDDGVGIQGLNVRKAIMPGQEYSAQLARGEIIPNYRELGAVAKYMAFYRRLGWGMHLPAVDSLLARTWRPAVLLRMGYVVRNGGEELFTWMMREGPSHYGKQKLAKTAADFHPMWDVYGRKTLVKGKDLPDEERMGLLWKPIASMWRSFNEIAGVGDFAVFRKSLLEVVEKNKDRWATLLEDSPELAFKLFEDTHEAVKLRTGRTVLGRTSKQLFEFSNAKANELSLIARDAFGRIPGMPTRQGLANRVLTKVAKDHEQRVAAVASSLTIPSLLDAQMREVLGTFDNYLNYSKNSMDEALRRGNSVENVDRLLKFTVDYQNTELVYVSNEPGSEMSMVRKAQAVAQRLSMHSDDIFARAYLQEVINYVSPRVRQELTATSEGLALAALSSGTPDEARRMRSLLADQSPEQIVLHLARENPEALHDLRVAFDRVGPGAHLDDAGDLVVTDLPFEAGWPDAVDDFIEAMPEGQQEIWRNLLDPEIGGQKVGANVNIVGYLLGQSDPARLVDDWDEAIRRARLAYFNEVMTPAGQQILRSVHRSNAGFAALGGKASELLPPGATRLFVPMVHVAYREALVEMLSGGRLYQGWADEMVDILTPRLREIGLGEKEALNAVRMLQPSIGPGNTGMTASSLVASANMWEEVGEGFFPLVVGSANPKVAHIVSQVVEDVLSRRTPARYRNVGMPAHRPGAGRISTMDVNSEELWNAPGLSAGSRPDELDITIVRNAVGSTTAQKDMATALGGEFMNSYYGWSETGATTAIDFGPRGLRDENVIGIAAQHLLSPRPGGLTSVPMLDGEPVTHLTRYYRSPRTGEFVVLRHGQEPSDDWFLDYELMEEQVTTGNDLHNMAEELAYINSFELNDLVSTGHRQDNIEIFHPWLREVLEPHEVSAVRVGAYASRARWWPNAPDNILAFMPVTEEGGKFGEKISKAWTTILRNWFDGVVNPMIGGMVREPLFQHYLSVGQAQTVGVRRIYHRPKVEVRVGDGAGGYEWVKEPYNYRLQRRLGVGRMDEDGQYVIDELEGFIEFDWPLAKADPENASSRLAAGIETRSPLATIDAITDLIEEGTAGMGARLSDDMKLGPSGRSPAVTRMESGRPTIVFDPDRITSQFDSRTVVQGGGGASLRDDTGVDIKRFMDNFGPEGAIQLTTESVTHPEKFLEILNQWRNSKGLRPIRRGAALDDELGFMAFIWEHEMTHIRLDHVGATDIPRHIKEMQANTITIQNLGIPLDALNADPNKIRLIEDLGELAAPPSLQSSMPWDVKQALRQVETLMQDVTKEEIRLAQAAELAKKEQFRRTPSEVKAAVIKERDRVQGEFFGYMLHRKVMADAHRDIAARRAMTLTSAYIDDHRIRSQFQAMVGTVVPFWFAEDNFLRRIGRSLKHNPLMFRNLHLTMNAGVYSGIVQEDQFGEKKIIIPGSEIATHAMLSIADKTPIVSSVFGGDLGSVQRPGMGIAMNIHVIPGYDLDSMGQLGLGPLLAAPINFASGRDAEIRQMFEHNLVGGRYPGASKLNTGTGGTVSSAFEAAWSSVAPALVVRAFALAGIDGPNGEARAKAKVDVLKFMAMNGSLPTEQEIASHSNPALYEEWFLEDVDEMARQYQLLQAMSWFWGPSTGQLADLTLHDNWEWNQEFHELLEMGLPYEEAYPQWVKNVEARTGEKFDPVEHSPFRTSGYTKIPFAVLETTQDANRWLVDNDAFARDFTMSSAFFMPRKFDVDDDEYVSEVKQRQLNMGLRKMDTSEEFLSELYFNISYPVYSKQRITYMTRKNSMRAMNMDTTDLDNKWDLWYSAFQMQHPVFVNQITTGTARMKRDSTVSEFRLLIESPELVPEGLHREDILNAMATIVGFSDKLDGLKGQSDPQARAKRDALRFQYKRIMEEFVHNKPWLNELYYSVFLPIIGESWIAKHEAGLVGIDMSVL